MKANSSKKIKKQKIQETEEEEEEEEKTNTDKEPLHSPATDAKFSRETPTSGDKKRDGLQGGWWKENETQN